MNDLREWIAEQWDPDLSLVEWRSRLVDSGFALAASDLAALGVPGPPDGVGIALVIPVLREHGSEDLRSRFIRPTLTGEITWCQLFSEPGAGSDLAGLATRAVRDGAGWQVTGQKVWSTGAKTADYGLLLARSDVDVPKHRGITALVLPMRQPGVEVRPLRQMNGHSSFNEVFIDGARVPDANVIGEPGGGWTVALTTLAHERRLAVFRPAAAPPGAGGRAWREAIEERTAAAEPHKWYPQRAGRPELVLQQARDNGKNSDPVMRQAIARLTETALSARWTAERFRASVDRGAGPGEEPHGTPRSAGPGERPPGTPRSAGPGERPPGTPRSAGPGERPPGTPRSPGPVGSLGKLASTDIARQSARAHGSIVGAAGMLAGPDAPLGGTIAEILVSVPGISIAGGTDEIQHTIIGERMLGLAREPDVSKDVPFRDVPR